jgi:hypothetical protein
VPVPAGSVLVACVGEPKITGDVYPVTAYVWPPMVALAEVMVIAVFQSLPMVQLTTCEPSEQTVVPERTD